MEVDLAVAAGNLVVLVVLVGSRHSQGKAQAESLVQVQGTSQAVRHKALEGNHPDLEDPHDPIHQEDLEGRMAGTVGDDRKEEHREGRGLAAGDLAAGS